MFNLKNLIMEKVKFFFLTILSNLFLMSCQVNPDLSYSNNYGFELTVDYSRTLVRVIDDGNYYYVNSDITENNFPRPVELFGHKINVYAKSFEFNRNISSAKAISIMEKAGYRPATLSEILALSELEGKKPMNHNLFPIVALGSTWSDHRGFSYVPTIKIDDDNYYLNISRYRRIFGWSLYWNFLAIKIA